MSSPGTANANQPPTPRSNTPGTAKINPPPPPRDQTPRPTRNNPACQHFHQAAHPTAPHNTAHLPAAGYVPNFQGFYSIVAPTGYTGMYPQVQAPPHQAPGPTGNNTQPADSYRLQYWLQQVNNRRLPDNSSTLPASQPAARLQYQIVELEDLSKELAQLNFSHTDIEMVDTAPIVDSATKGKQAYMTGQGSLHFNGLANQGVMLHGVLYS
ncbi:hypothetical protein PCASD_01900 [Puccinia coronata f. sp. avenae]|uniref:Uncharacterized protein n=1 Tax=Puccinia coronata f. sp. avenae TaxID=200324 RepID=A0A2N5VJL0_9BASI|nr:hypothetical protein PCASD_24177 [Puccinia coronata f. sp. avenae]PLW50194.1 hypothetical protein PCASD_01900 [Puccinia coronata f. sp. avenae]